jgi:hypothetical protein
MDTRKASLVTVYINKIAIVSSAKYKMSLNEVLERGQRVKLLSGEKGIIIGKNENFEFPLWEIKLENGKILTEARYRFDVLTEVSKDPGNSDSPPTVSEEHMHLFQSEIYESDDSDMPIVSVLPDPPPSSTKPFTNTSI